MNEPENVVIRETGLFEGEDGEVRQGVRILTIPANRVDVHYDVDEVLDAHDTQEGKCIFTCTSSLVATDSTMELPIVSLSTKDLEGLTDTTGIGYAEFDNIASELSKLLAEDFKKHLATAIKTVKDAA